jgi:uncharacterized alkaline shock family protein YloU
MDDRLGSVSIAPQVLCTVARFAARAVPGVAGFSKQRPVSVERLLRRTAVDEGIAISVEDNNATIDLYVICERTANMLETSRRIQAEVARAIQETVGTSIREINVHIEDVAINVAGDDQPARRSSREQ